MREHRETDAFWDDPVCKWTFYGTFAVLSFLGAWCVAGIATQLLPKVM